jgi:hypothetical protein
MYIRISREGSQAPESDHKWNEPRSIAEIIEDGIEPLLKGACGGSSIEDPLTLDLNPQNVRCTDAPLEGLS